MPSRKILAATAIVLVLGAFGASKLMGGKGGGQEEQQQGGFGMPVEAAQAKADTLRITVNAVGTLVAQEGIVVRPEIAGIVTAVNFTEGQKVEQGQSLITLDDSIYRAQLDQAEAQLALAERNYNRAVALVGRGAGTEQSRDQTSSDLRVAKAALELAKANLAKTNITAPFAGTVGIRKISLGSYLQPGQEIVSLQALNPMKLDFGVPETALASLSVGQKVQVSVTAYPDTTFEGTVSAIDPLVDPATRSVAVRALVPNDDNKLTPGLFASVTLVTKEQPDTVFIPAASIWPVGNQSFAFKITEGMANMTPVTIISREADRVAIAAGAVAAGDQVVTAGQNKLVMGPPGPVPVTVLDPNAQQAAPGAAPAAPEGEKPATPEAAPAEGSKPEEAKPEGH